MIHATVNGGAGKGIVIACGASFAGAQWSPLFGAEVSCPECLDVLAIPGPRRGRKPRPDGERSVKVFCWLPAVVAAEVATEAAARGVSRGQVLRERIQGGGRCTI